MFVLLLCACIWGRQMSLGAGFTPGSKPHPWGQTHVVKNLPLYSAFWGNVSRQKIREWERYSRRFIYLNCLWEVWHWHHWCSGTHVEHYYLRRKIEKRSWIRFLRDLPISTYVCTCICTYVHVSFSFLILNFFAFLPQHLFFGFVRVSKPTWGNKKSWRKILHKNAYIHSRWWT
jgi:hypothetical protein